MLPSGKLSAPAFSLQRHDAFSVQDFPGTDVVPVFAGGNLFEFDKSGALSRPAGYERAGSLTPIEFIGDGLLAGGPKGYFLIRQRRDDAACEVADRAPTPLASLRVQPVDPAWEKWADGMARFQAIPGGGTSLVAVSVNNVSFIDSSGKAWILAEGGYATRVMDAPNLAAVVSLPWSNQAVVIGGRDALVVQANGTFSRVELPARGRFFYTQGPFPESGLALATVEERQHYIFSRDRPGAVPLNVGRPAPRVELDVPWLGGLLAVESGKVGIASADGQILAHTIKGVTLGPYERLFGAREKFMKPGVWEIRKLEFVLGYRNGWSVLTRDWELRPLTRLGVPDFDVLDVYEKAAHGVLLGTTTGLLLLDKKGRVRRPDRPATKLAIRAIAASSATRGLLAGGEEGLFSVDGRGLSAVGGATWREVGTVRRLVDLPWREETLVYGSLGLFVLNANRLISQIPDAPDVDGIGQILVSPEQRAIRLVTNGRRSNWQIYDLVDTR